MSTASPAKPIDPRPQIVIGILMLLGVLYGYGKLIIEGLDAASSAKWPTATATINRSDLEATRSKAGKSSVTTWTPRLRYAYTVEGQPYFGEHLRLGGFPSFDDKEVAEGVMAKYPEGGTAEVYYHPSNPERSVLEPGMGGALSGLGLGAFLLLFPLGLAALIINGGIQLGKAARAAATAQA